MEQQDLINEGYADGKRSLDFVVKEIFEGFNFEKVYQTMKALDWVWYFGVEADGREKYGIPNIQTLKNSAYRMLKEVYERGKGSNSTRGFRAGWDGGELYLTFSIEENSATAMTSPVQSETEVSEG